MYDLPSELWFVAYLTSIVAFACAGVAVALPARFGLYGWTIARWIGLLLVVVIVADLSLHFPTTEKTPEGKWTHLAITLVGAGVILLMRGISNEAAALRLADWRRKAFLAAVLLAAVLFSRHRLYFTEPPNLLSTDQMKLISDSHRDFTPIPGAFAYTDLGTAIPLHRYEDIAEGEEISPMELIPPATAGRLIVEDPHESFANCHGWVFTGGKYMVRGQFVDTILQDNGYFPVSTPIVGDIVIYRDGTHTPVHTGLVKAVGQDGFVLVEGKWGSLGVYLHLPHEQPYSRDFEYYRSNRPGHLLLDIPRPPVTDPRLPAPRVANVPESAE